ncbi:E3 ubiquitin-protein ligase TRIM37 [Trichoplax sp. H2]|nr:E3 ubiquitin-protein ligase TRIM37 [Trichoplax sp. H2]|eukprot:RDD44773.1 E3 ubiquitin-protein ligase TRIM37 [Trichoplax sp. H2]
MSAAATTTPACSDVQNIKDVFRCFICMEKLKDARLCPHCSKLCCHTCMRRWLCEQRSHCPHCRAHLHIHELVKCRWVEEVTDQLESLKFVSQNNKSHTKITPEDSCEIHKEKLTVFCNTCMRSICHQCALWGGDIHHGHSFQPIEDIYKQCSSKISNEVNSIRQRIGSFVSKIEETDKKIEKIKRAKDIAVQEVQVTFNNITSRLDRQLKQKLEKLHSQKDNLSSQMHSLEQFLSEIDRDISQSSKSRFIARSTELQETMEEIRLKSIESLITEEIEIVFDSEVVPRFAHGSFHIKDYTRKKRYSNPLYSRMLDTHGLKWRLKVYPNGSGSSSGEFLSVFLELHAGPQRTSKYEYRIELVHQGTSRADPKKNIIREFASDFDVGESWGYNRFFRLDLLSREGYLVNDSIQLRFSVRHPSYYSKCSDLEWVVEMLEKKHQNVVAELGKLKERLLKGNPEEKISKDEFSSETRVELELSSLDASIDESSARFALTHKKEDEVGSDESLNTSEGRAVAGLANTPQSKCTHRSLRRNSPSNVTITRSSTSEKAHASTSSSLVTNQHQNARQLRESQLKLIANDASHQARKDTYVVNNQEIIVVDSDSDLDGISNGGVVLRCDSISLSSGEINSRSASQETSNESCPSPVQRLLTEDNCSNLATGTYYNGNHLSMPVHQCADDETNNNTLPRMESTGNNSFLNRDILEESGN